MRRIQKLTFFVAAGPAWLHMACATGMPQPRLNGADVTVRLHAPDVSKPVRGELVIVGPQKLVVIDKGVREIPRDQVRQVDLVRRRHAGRVGFIVTFLGAALSALAVHNECTDGTSFFATADCSDAIIGATAVWLVIGGGLSALEHVLARKHVSESHLDDLRPFARFPEGLPPGLGVEELIPKPGLIKASPQPKTDGGSLP